MLVKGTATPLMGSLDIQLVINPILAHSQEKTKGKKTSFPSPQRGFLCALSQ